MADLSEMNIKVRRPAIFRVSPESKYGFYFNVFVFSTCKEMQEAADLFGKETGANGEYFDTSAITFAHRRWFEPEDGSKFVWSREIGAMFFNEETLCMEVVCHECAHAGLRWLEQKKLSLESLEMGDLSVSSVEERFAMAVGMMAKQINVELYEHGIWH
jgi:hypothetical protein